MKQGSVIVYRSGGVTMCYFYVGNNEGKMVFAKMFVVDFKPTDFWRMTPEWFDQQIAEGKLTIYEDGLPHDVAEEVMDKMVF